MNKLNSYAKLDEVAKVLSANDFINVLKLCRHDVSDADIYRIRKLFQAAQD